MLTSLVVKYFILFVKTDQTGAGEETNKTNVPGRKSEKKKKNNKNFKFPILLMTVQEGF